VFAKTLVERLLEPSPDGSTRAKARDATASFLARREVRSCSSCSCCSSAQKSRPTSVSSAADDSDCGCITSGLSLGAASMHPPPLLALVRHAGRIRSHSVIASFTW
jgi:hypothetical protein